jgi:hypothetical protein
MTEKRFQVSGVGCQGTEYLKLEVGIPEFGSRNAEVGKRTVDCGS